MPRYSLAILIGFVLAVLGQSNFSNPVIYEDFADNDIFLGPDNVFYYSASNMHYSPGAPILQSYDLVNWQLIGHSVPSLNFGSQYNMTGNQTAYTQGTWASTLRYRQSNNQWYWIGCINFWTTYVYTASSPTGPWTQSASFQPCFYDCGLMIDDDDTMYVVYGSNNVSIAQLSSDGLSVVETQPVFNYPSQCTGIEGNRLYKRNGIYYVLDDCPSEGITVIWQSSSIWGPWTDKILIDGISSPVPSGGSPDQGSLIETQNGDWYFMSFTWAYPAGRMPILAPITWGTDGFPVLTEVDGGWGASYQYQLTPQSMPPWTGTDTFQGTSLGVAWEWNHNPDSTKYVVNNGLTLYTVTVTDDLYHARNTLTHRINGQFPVGTVEIDFSNMADGDTCGLAAFRDQSAWIGIVRSGSIYTVTAVQGLAQNSSNSWATTSTGSIVGTAQISQTKVWLRVSMDARASGSKLANFFYSIDGLNFNQLGGSFTMATDWEYFMGYRFGIFNFATEALGGSINVISFDSDDANSGPTSVAAVPTTTTTMTTSTAATTSLSQITTMTTTTTAPSGNSSAQSEYGQCGGIGWTGPTSCQSPYACETQNAYYAQCL